eukprot:SM000200S05830  [mRNA]  locus=s200:226987:227626:+ [translate_table: standard]
MPGGGSFLHRVVQYVANELIVDRLANSPAFQRFAVRSQKAVEDLARRGAEKQAQLAQQAQELQASLREEVSRAFQDPNNKRP